ncbi:MAG: AAA family ATPase [Butyricicoccaceae bacterium]
MHIKTLKLQNFRNYEDARFVLDPAVNLICGENGQGKTNLLEAAAAMLDHAAVPHGAEEGRTAVRRGCGIHLLGIRGAGA